MAYEPWRPGMRITADRLNAGIMGDWQSWTPVFSTTSGANLSTFGSNSTIDCRYVIGGNTCQFVFNIQFGSTATFSAAGDNWTWSLPVSAAQSATNVGSAALYPGNGTDASMAQAYLHTTDTFYMYIQSRAVGGAAGSAGIVDAQAPFPWVAGDRIQMTGVYQIA